MQGQSPVAAAEVTYGPAGSGRPREAPPAPGSCSGTGPRAASPPRGWGRAGPQRAAASGRWPRRSWRRPRREAAGAVTGHRLPTPAGAGTDKGGYRRQQGRSGRAPGDPRGLLLLPLSHPCAPNPALRHGQGRASGWERRPLPRWWAASRGPAAPGCAGGCPPGTARASTDRPALIHSNSSQRFIP